MTARILDGVAIAATIRAEVQVEVAKMVAHGVTPGLAVVLVGEDPASQIYVRSKGKACREAGMHSETVILSAEASEDELLDTIERLNYDHAIHGILCQLPVPKQIDTERVLRAVHPMKDVDGFQPVNVGKLVLGDPTGFKPATPYGVQQILIRSCIETKGANALVIGRSTLVGRPMANLLSQSGLGGDATVTVAHSRTKNLPGLIKEADIVIAAIGRPEFVHGDMLKPGATVIDVGINRIDDASLPKGYRIAGDVHFDSAKEVAGAITPVPGGVGPMTIAMLLVNTLQAARLQTACSLNPDEAWSVAKLAGTIKRRVEAGFDPVWVRGEVVGLKRYPSGHLYFGLRDATAKVDCTMWKFAAQRLSQSLEEGVEVFALGTASVWEERTSLRFNVTQMVPAAAVGASALAVEKIRQALAADGLLDPARKRPLPEYPRRIAVVTSIAGAAVRDIITVASRRWPGIELLVVNSAVQGANAPAEIIAALGIVSQITDVDCCIVGRGGGGKEDLAAFNDEAVCRAIAACKVPVVSAVGHEVDVTLADLVADLRAATPSQAAEFVLPERGVAEQRLQSLTLSLTRSVSELIQRRQDRIKRTRDRMGHALTGQLRTAERRLSRVRERMAPALSRQVQRPRQRLTRLGDMLAPIMQRRLLKARSALAQSAAKIHALSPVAVLARGYAMARTPDGTLLKQTTDFPVGRLFNLRVTDGSISARVEPS